MFKKDKISQYIDTTGALSNKQLKFSSWYLSHKILLGKIGIGVIIAFCVLTVGFSSWKWGEYLFFGYWEDQRNLLVGQAIQIQNYSDLQNIYKAQDIKVTDIRVFSSSEGMYDFFSIVQNPNERWIADISYHFSYVGGETEVNNTILLPGAKRPAAIFGHDSKSFPSTARFVIDDISWKSVDPHEVFNTGDYINSRRAFAIDDFDFKEPSESGVPVPSITFDLHNDTAYSYWQPVFYIEFLNGNQTVGYNFLSIDQFRSSQKKEIDIRYFGGNITVTNIRVIPIINFFDQDVYMNPGDDF